MTGHYGYSLVEPLRRAETLYARKEAILDADRRLAYGELASRCKRLGPALRGLGLGEGDRVATLLANGHRALETLLGIPAAGAVVVPLNSRLAPQELQRVLDDAGVKLLISDGLHAQLAAQLAPSVGRSLDADGYEQAVTAAEEAPYAEVSSQDLAALFYTGGTTGAAKGVMLSHGNLAANALQTSVAVGFRESDVYLHAAPMFHLADGLATWAMTWLGGVHAFVPQFEPDAVLELIARERVTVALWVPAMLNTLVCHPRVAEVDTGSLRLVLHGGAPIATELLRAATAEFSCSFAQLYGMTEAAPVLTALTREEELLDSERLRSAGREVPGVEVTVRRDDGSLCPPGEIGEVVARGPNIMQGYWNKPEETEAALRDGWYWTGDLGYLDEDRFLFIVDRAKDMIITGGENVYSVEVEDAVAAHPAVVEVAVIGVPDDHWGERVHAIVALRTGAELEIDELRAFCKQRIAGYKAPRSLEPVPALPKSGAGKVLKRELRDEHWADQARKVH